MKPIPSLRTLPTGSFSCRILSLGPFHFEVLFLCAAAQVSTPLLQRLYVAACYCNSNSVSGHVWFYGCLSGTLKRMAAAGFLTGLLLGSANRAGQEQEQEREGRSSASAAPRLPLKSSWFFLLTPGILPLTVRYCLKSRCEQSRSNVKRTGGTCPGPWVVLWGFSSRSSALDHFGGYATLHTQTSESFQKYFRMRICQVLALKLQCWDIILWSVSSVLWPF